MAGADVDVAGLLQGEEEEVGVYEDEEEPEGERATVRLRVRLILECWLSMTRALLFDRGAPI